MLYKKIRDDFWVGSVSCILGKLRKIASSKEIGAGNSKSKHGTERGGHKTQNGEDLEYSLLLPLSQWFGTHRDIV